MSGESTVRRDPYAALRYRDFRLLITGRLVAQIGEMMVSVGVGWELYERTHDAWMLGLVGLAQVMPSMLFSLPAGNAADRFPRRDVLLAATLARAALLGAAALAVAAGRATPEATKPAEPRPSTAAPAPASTPATATPTPATCGRVRISSPFQRRISSVKTGPQARISELENGVDQWMP